MKPNISLVAPNQNQRTIERNSTRSSRVRRASPKHSRAGRQNSVTLFLVWLTLALLPLSDVYIEIGSGYLIPTQFTTIPLVVWIVINTVLRRNGLISSRLRIFTIQILALVFVVIAVGFLNGSVISTLGFIVSMLFAPIVASVARTSNAWTTPVLIAGVISVLVAYGHLFGVVPVFEFERVGNGLDTSSLLGIGYTGLISARGEYGIFLLFVLLAAMQVLSRKHLTIFMIFIAGAVLISISRSTWSAFLVLFTIVILSKWLRVSSRQIRFRRQIWLVFALIVIATLYFMAGGADLASSLYSDLVGVREVSVTYRLDQNTWALDSLLTYAFGGGEEDATSLFGLSIHNVFLFLSITYGLAAMCILLWLVAHVVYVAYASATKANTLVEFELAVSILAVVLGVVVEMNLYPKFQSSIFWALLGVVAGLLARKYDFAVNNDALGDVIKRRK